MDVEDLPLPFLGCGKAAVKGPTDHKYFIYQRTAFRRVYHICFDQVLSQTGVLPLNFSFYSRFDGSTKQVLERTSDLA